LLPVLPGNPLRGGCGVKRWSLLGQVLRGWRQRKSSEAVALRLLFLGLDAYLAQHYGAEFTAYASKTKKLIPYIY
jgi:hypothetical protein